MEGGPSAKFAIQTTTKRSGAASYQMPNTNPNNVYASLHYLDSTDSLIVRAYIYIPTGESPDEEHAFIVMGDGTDADAYKITIDSSRQLRIYNVTTLIGSASDALSVDTWYRVDFRADTSASAGSHILQGRLDGVEFAGATNLTMTTSPITQWSIGWNLDGWNGDQDNGTMYYDDIVATAESGGGQAAFEEDYGLDVLYVNADEGTPDGSSSGSNDFYEDVGETNDDPTPDDATTYWILDANNDVAEGKLQPRTDSGVGATDTIHFIAVYTRIANAGSGTASYTARIRGQSSGTPEEGDSRSHGKTTWWPYADQWSEKSPGLVSYTNPQDFAAWEASDLDNVCVGLKVTDANPDLYLTCIAAIVAFSPPGDIERTLETASCAMVANDVGAAKDVSRGLETSTCALAANDVGAEQDISRGIETPSCAMAAEDVAAAQAISRALETAVFAMVAVDVAAAKDETRTLETAACAMSAEDVGAAKDETRTLETAVCAMSAEDVGAAKDETRTLETATCAIEAEDVDASMGIYADLETAAMAMAAEDVGAAKDETRTLETAAMAMVAEDVGAAKDVSRTLETATCAVEANTVGATSGIGPPHEFEGPEFQIGAPVKPPEFQIGAPVKPPKFQVGEEIGGIEI
jgi:hypothetical protein